MVTRMSHSVLLIAMGAGCSSVTVPSVKVDAVFFDPDMIWIEATLKTFATEVTGIMSLRHCYPLKKEMQGPGSWRSLFSFPS